jgi:hypothetical protein
LVAGSQFFEGYCETEETVNDKLNWSVKRLEVFEELDLVDDLASEAAEYFDLTSQSYQKLGFSFKAKHADNDIQTMIPDVPTCRYRSHSTLVVSCVDDNSWDIRSFALGQASSTGVQGRESNFSNTTARIFRHHIFGQAQLVVRNVLKIEHLQS